MLRLPRRKFALLFAPWLLLAAGRTESNSNATARVQAIRFWSFGDVTRVAIQTQGDYKLFSDQIENPPRVYFDLTGMRPPATQHHGVQTINIKDRLVKQIRVAEVTPGKTRVVLDLQTAVNVVSSQLVNPDRLMIEIRPRTPSNTGVSLARTNTASERIDLSDPKDDKAPRKDQVKKDPAKNSSLPPVSHSGATNKSSSGPAPIVVVQNSGAKMPDTNQDEPSGDQVIPTALSSTASHENSAPQVPLAMGTPPAKPAPDTPAANSLIASREELPNMSLRAAGAASAAKRDSGGDRSLVRVFGLKLGKVVIDAGHGGHDTGTIGPGGLMEKDLVLDVALRLGKLVTQRVGAQVVYTRSGDVFIPLEQRTHIANNERADLFISIHANSSPEPKATGVETFYFNLTSDKVGLDLATRENATSSSSISDLNDLLHKAVLENKLEESREFAQKIQSALWASSVKLNSRSRDRGVRQAPFVVLIGATMPSILAEIGFVSNPHDERLLRRSEQRQKIAEALLKGIEQYGSTLSHEQIARARVR